MATFTADELQAIAQSFQDISNRVSQVRLDAIHGGRQVDDPQIVTLLGQGLSLSNLASNFVRQAAQVTLDDADGAAHQISGATGAAHAALNQLALLSKAINIAASVLVLGATVFTADPEAMAGAVAGVYKAAAS